MTNQSQDVKNHYSIVVKYPVDNPPEHCLLAEQLRMLSRFRMQSQVFRKQFKRSAETKMELLDEDIKTLVDTPLRSGAKANEETERALESIMKPMVKRHPWASWLLAIRGLSTLTAAVVIGECDGLVYFPIEKDKKMEEEDLKGRKRIQFQKQGYGRTFDCTSDLWAFAGYHLKEGKAVHRKRGEQSNWNKHLKQALFTFIDSSIKVKGDYAKVYDKEKARQKTLHPELTPKHAHNRAIRYAIKRFLSDFKWNCLNVEIV